MPKNLLFIFIVILLTAEHDRQFNDNDREKNYGNPDPPEMPQVEPFSSDEIPEEFPRDGLFDQVGRSGSVLGLFGRVERGASVLGLFGRVGRGASVLGLFGRAEWDGPVLDLVEGDLHDLEELARVDACLRLVELVKRVEDAESHLWDVDGGRSVAEGDDGGGVFGLRVRGSRRARQELEVLLEPIGRVRGGGHVED